MLQAFPRPLPDSIASYGGMNKSRICERLQRTQRRSNSLLSAVVCGFASGLGGLSAMDRFTSLAARCSLGPVRPLAFSVEEWDATTRIANSMALWMTGRNLSEKELKKGAAIVHHATAATAGVLYGALVYRSTTIAQSRMNSGLAGAFLGVGVWLIGDEMLLPALGVLKRRHYTAGMRTEALLAHLTYGIATGLFYRQLMGNLRQS